MTTSTPSDTLVDSLTRALHLMHMTGTIVLAESYTPPWGIAIPNQDGLGQLLFTTPETTAVAFHHARRGSFRLTTNDGTPIPLSEGDTIIGFGGNSHTISEGHPLSMLGLAEYVGRQDQRISQAAVPLAVQTQVICGVFFLRDTVLNPLFGALPPFLHLQAATLRAPHAGMLLPTLLANELERGKAGMSFALQRLLELLCLEAIRAYMEQTKSKVGGWLTGLDDPIIGKVLHHFHQTPQERWSVRRLAEEANLSPSRFAARFVQTIGESCMAYVARWRMNVARDLLQTTDCTINEVAYQVGYTDTTSFIRTFKRHLGASPASWRKAQQAPDKGGTTGLHAEMHAPRKQPHSGG